MVIMAIDPSFRNAAVSIFDGNNTVYIDTVSCSLGENIGFEKVFHACHSQWEGLYDHLSRLGIGKSLNIDVVVSEIPPPVGQFSSGLYALDTYLLSNLWSEYLSIKELYVLSPSYLSTIHQTHSYKKSDSTKLAKYYINEVLTELNIVIPESISETGRHMKGTLNNDKAESFLFLLRMFCKYNINGWASKIFSEMSGFNYPAEKLLIHR